MMGRSVLDESFNEVLQTTAEKVARIGFVRHGAALRVIDKTNSGIIEFQKSTKSSRERLLFTINLGIICGELLEPDQPRLNKARIRDAHLRHRVGMLLPSRQDKWWEITASTDANVLAAEVSDIIVREVVPYIQRYLDTDDLIALWESGKSPGLTDLQRIRYLDKLRNARNTGGA
jgi:hypothetical protein